MTGVFLDSVGLIALWNQRDQWHAAATHEFAALSATTEFFSTSYVVAECGNAFARSEVRGAVVRLGDRLDASRGLIYPSDADWHEAWVRFSASHPRGPGLVDEISFAMMRRLGLRRAFTNDRHFADAGFEPLS